LIRNIPEFNKTAVDDIVNGEIPSPNGAELHFGYDEIAGHLVRLDERMLSLLNAEEGRLRLTTMDRELLDAAEDLDLERMQVAVREGANVNALENGESALARVAMAGYDQQPNPRKIDLVDWLLQHGADINLFGYEGLAPLTTAVLQHDPDLVRHLLRHGADPTSDQSPEENYSFEPSASFFAGGDLYVVDEGAEEYVDAWEINVLELLKIFIPTTAVLEDHMRLVNRHGGRYGQAAGG